MIIKYVKTFKNKLYRFWGNSCNLAKQLKPPASSQEEYNYDILLTIP